MVLLGLLIKVSEEALFPLSLKTPPFPMFFWSRTTSPVLFWVCLFPSTLNSQHFNHRGFQLQILVYFSIILKFLALFLKLLNVNTEWNVPPMLTCYFGHKVIILTRENSCWETQLRPWHVQALGISISNTDKQNKLNREGVGTREGKRKKEGRRWRKEG